TFPWKRGVLCPHGVLDAVNLLLVAPAVHHGALLGIPQCSLQVSIRVTTSDVVRSVSGTFSPEGEGWSSVSSFWMVSFMVLFFSFSFSYFLFHCSAVSSRLMEAVFLMVLALCIYRCPNIRVDLVSASL
uniref:Uncharacterized protein n=1 Tax=Dicentrarchus labrax TaxID=13489 RepID=A0A8C4GW54_DICLA